MSTGLIKSINISRKKGGKKYPVSRAVVCSEGIEGDGHSGNWHRQVSLLSYESIQSFNIEAEKKIKKTSGNRQKYTGFGDFGENITTEGIDLSSLKIGDRLFIYDGSVKVNSGRRTDSDGISGVMEAGNDGSRSGDDSLSGHPVILEVTQVGKECLSPCRIYYRVGFCIMPQEGIFCKVIKKGLIKIGYKVSY